MDHFFVHYDIATIQILQSNGELVNATKRHITNILYVATSSERCRQEAQDLHFVFYRNDRNCVERHLGSIKSYVEKCVL